MKKEIRYMRSLLTIIIIAFIGGATQGCSPLFTPSEKLYSRAMADLEPYDAIIVPGLPFDGKKWDDLLKKRVYWAFYLYSEGKAKNVIFSGSSVYSPYVEAEIMAMYGIALGIPKKNIFMEKKAQHSTENLYYSYQLARKQGFKKIGLATDNVQGRFLYFFSNKKNIPVTFIPAQFEIIDKMNPGDPEIDFQKAFVKDFVPLTEKEGFFKRLKGTKGNNIIFEEEEVQDDNVSLREKDLTTKN